MLLTSATCFSADNRPDDSRPDAANIPPVDGIALKNSESHMTPESTQSDAMTSNDLTVSENSDASCENSWVPADLPGTVLAVDQAVDQGIDQAIDQAADPAAVNKLAVRKVIDETTTSENSPENSEEDTKITAARERELLKLIHDLNECNDVLLSRVSHLETTLENSQENALKTLQKERESAKAAQDQMRERANTQQASAQQMSQQAQQQVASLVDQLETAQQEFQRQQLVNETLLAELENAKERVTQLEHECALNAQQQAEEAQSRVKAESTIRDLRSRLQRQQRYTLQFKAALEKSLTVTNRPTASGTQENQRTIHAAVQPISSPIASPVSSRAAAVASGHLSRSTAANGVTMPKAQRIVPWAAQSTAPFEGIDPHLESLIRGAGNAQPTQSSTASTEKALAQQTSDSASGSHASNSTPESSETLKAALAPKKEAEKEAETEAESQLWQDLERVMDNEAQAIEDQAIENQIAEDQDTKDLSQESADESSKDSPKFNWQPQRQQLKEKTLKEKLQSEEKTSAEALPTVETPVPADKALKEIAEKTAEEQASISAAEIDSSRSNLPSIVIDPYTVPEGQTPAAEVDFTEPSPWGSAKKVPEEIQEETKTQDETEAQAKGSDSLVLPASVLEQIQHPVMQSMGSQSLGGDSAANNQMSSIDGESSSVSPVVNPLRSPKKKNSLATVQLPTFEKAKVSSFRR